MQTAASIARDDSGDRKSSNEDGDDFLISRDLINPSEIINLKKIKF